MLLFNLLEELEKIMGDFQSFIIENKNNPVLWVGLFVVGLLVFKAVYSSLSKD